MKYTIDHIPKNTDRNRRPGNAMIPESITIHNTGNPRSTARNERDWLINPENTVIASYHIVIDEREAIECIPLSENAWHAGDDESGPGNRTSIGIELCESGNYVQTVENSVKRVASMLRERGWGVDRLRRHFDWSGKICPRKMHDGGEWSGWNEFKKRVQSELQKNDPHMLNLDDANKMIRFLSAGWFVVQGNKKSEAEFHRLANALREASGQSKK